MFRRSSLVAAIAFVLSIAVGAQSAQAAEGPGGIREFADRLQNNCGLLISWDECLELMEDPDRIIGGEGVVTMPGPAALSGLRGFTSSALRQFTGRCTVQAVKCVQLGFLSLMATLGLIEHRDDLLEVFSGDNPDWAGLPEPGSFPDGMYAVPSGGNAGTLIPTGHTGDTVSRFYFDYALLNPTNSFGHSYMYWGVEFQCREIATGDVGPLRHILYQSIANSSVPKYGTTFSDGAFCGHASFELTYFATKPATSGGVINYPENWYVWGAPSGATDDPMSEGTGGARLRCEDSLGSEYFVTVEAAEGTWDIPAPQCLEGDTPTGLEIGPVAPGGGIAADTIYDLSPDALKADPGDYPYCADHACLYHVRIGGQPCTVGQAGCIQWTRNSAATCYYGPYQVDIRLCSFLERAYEIGAAGVPVGTQPGTLPGTTANTDGDPDTTEGPQPEPEFPNAPPVAPPGAGGPLPEACYSGTYPGIGTVSAEAAYLAEIVGNMFEVDDIGGYRASDPYPDHPSGRALDLMVYTDKAKGDAIAAYLQNNAAALNVEYIIWYQQIWNVNRANEGWRDMEDRGSDTANHKDHVHVTVYTGAMGVDCGTGGGAGGECFPNGWTWNPINWVLEPVKCAFRWAFIMDPVKTDVSIAKIRTAWMSHPPGSIITALGPTMEAVGTGLVSGECTGLPGAEIAGHQVELPCEPPGGGGGPWDVLYTVAQAGIVVITIIYVWSMVSAAVSGRATGV